MPKANSKSCRSRRPRGARLHPCDPLPARAQLFTDADAAPHSVPSPGIAAIPIPGKGTGVIALQTFRPGDVIITVRGHVIDDPDYGSDYCMALNDDLILEPYSPGGLVCHSCNPNAELADHPTESHALAIIALTNIEPGLEICYDYAWPAEAVETICRCRCGAHNCRGWIVAQDELQEFLAKKKAAAKKKTAARKSATKKTPASPQHKKKTAGRRKRK